MLQVVRRAPQLTEHLMKIQRRATRRRKMWGARCDTVTALVGLSTPSIGILFSFAAAWSLCHTLYQRLVTRFTSAWITHFTSSLIKVSQTLLGCTRTDASLAPCAVRVPWHACHTAASGPVYFIVSHFCVILFLFVFCCSFALCVCVFSSLRRRPQRGRAQPRAVLLPAQQGAHRARRREPRHAHARPAPHPFSSRASLCGQQPPRLRVVPGCSYSSSLRMNRPFEPVSDRSRVPAL